MTEKFRILYATMEIAPFLKITDAADYLSSLPQGLQEQGHEIRILMPKFGVINERRNKLHEVVRLSGINIRVGNEEKPLTIKVATIPNVRLQVYFLDNEDYFQRKSVLNDPKNNNHFYKDNDERAIFFCKGLIETVKKLGWNPHLIHCHGWMTALIPLYLKTHYKDDPVFKYTKIIYTAYNENINFPLPLNFIEKARLDGIDTEVMRQYVDGTYEGVVKSGIRMADFVTKGSPELSPGLEECIRQLKKDVTYDFNGQDKSSYINYYSQLYKEILLGVVA
ncbi:MAG: glycogen/starch synthase [Bacteroidia bacterium]|nr:glycogen/starch synthase [Bacteroidia bacterium]MDW8158304.1 glycogen/starch synthase [Bacteroidia bacterium]